MTNARILPGARVAALITAFLAASPSRAVAPPPALPNPSFEEGERGPAGWTHVGAGGQWLSGAASDGGRAIATSGDGRTTTYWHSPPLDLRPGGLYQLRFRARRLGEARGGTPLSGPLFCNRDLGDLPAAWTLFRSHFAAPARPEPRRAFLRFGQWHTRGALAFDQVELLAAQAIYARWEEMELGAGERVQGRHYRFAAPFQSQTHNHSRPLAAHQCDFNTNRWVFGPQSYVVYRHQVGGRQQVEGSIRVGVGHHESGALAVDFSGDGRHWHELGQLAQSGEKRFSIADALLPVETAWVRLRALDGPGAPPGAFQVVSYEYEATLAGAPLPLRRGRTHYAAIEAADALVDVQILELGDALPGGDNAVRLAVDNRAGRSLAVAPRLRLAGAAPSQARATLPPGRNELRLPYALAESGEQHLEIALGGECAFRATIALYIAPLYDLSYGQRLPGSGPAAALWGAHSAWKVGRRRPAPADSGAALYLSAARGEYEAVQLVITPRRPLRGLRAEAGALRTPAGDRIDASRIDLLRVGYVDVEQPTDASGAADSWPDPLLPLAAPLDLQAGVNQPLWVRVFVPPGAGAGLYRGHIALAAEAFRAEVPLVLEVYDFQLPDETSCRTAVGLSLDQVARYQHLRALEEKRQVLDLYLQSFSRHRLSPFDPAPLDPFTVRWQGLEPVFSWAAWDSAMAHALDRFHFNSFRLRPAGLGGGTFLRRTSPRLCGHPQGTPEYERALGAYLSALQAHLQARGWLDEAYVYWFDEPQPQDYAFVNEGFARLKRHAPRLHRLLTEQVEEALVGGPTIWCPLTAAFSPQRAAERRRAGESFWWYICTEPKAPYAGLFIDRAGIELRTWLWQAWQYGIEGILIWQSTYWHGDAAYGDSLQNPYADPMSWMSRYSGAPPGSRRPWGNGDGRLLYPPPEAAAGADHPIIAGPVESMRWEMLRDGLEDYEYLALLRQHLRARPRLRARYEHLLQVPPALSADLTHFSRDPAPLEAHRRALARALARLAEE